MRCPKCKRFLILGKPRNYQTLVEHVSDPNNNSYFERPTLICPSCYGENAFFDEDGSLYGSGDHTDKSLFALDSAARRIEISILLDGIRRDTKYVDYLEDLRIEGETDVPPQTVLTELVGKQFCAII